MLLTCAPTACSDSSLDSVSTISAIAATATIANSLKRSVKRIGYSTSTVLTPASVAVADT